MNGALIVSRTEQTQKMFAEMLRVLRCDEIVTVSTGGEARRTAMNREFDLCIVNAPLSDETGEALARDLSEKSYCQVLLLTDARHFDEIAHAVEDSGVITLSKPLQKELFWNALKLAAAAQVKIARLRKENVRLARQIEDIKIVNRAKCILISTLNMSEDRAHRYIEKQAMDLRTTKRSVAEDILRTYDY